MTLIVSFGTLKTAIAAKANRTDLTAHMPGFVQNAEAHFNRELRHGRNLYRFADFAFTSEYTAIPSDVIEMVAIELYINGYRRRLEPDMLPNQVNARGTDPGDPVGFSVHEGFIRLSPPPRAATTGDLYYFRGVPTITANDANTNWLLTRFPDVYLYRSMMEAALHMQDEKRFQSYGVAYVAAWESLMRNSARYRQAAAMTVRRG